MKTVRLRGSDYTKYIKNIDGYRARTKKSLFDEYGPVRIAGPSGRFIGVVHSDPGDAPEPQAPVEVVETGVSEEKMQKQLQSMKRHANSGNLTSVPSPKSCKCATWPVTEGEVIERDARGKQTEHRRTCAYRKRWERQSFRLQQSSPTKVLEPIHHHAGKVVNPSTAKPSKLGRSNPTQKVKSKLDKIPAPLNCPQCGTWTQTKKHQEQYPNQHHQLCPHFKKYLSLSTMQQTMGVKPKPAVSSAFLYNLQTQEQVREAEQDEVLEARRRLRDEGAALCSVGDDEYFVMLEDGTQLEALEPEVEAAHSDTDRPPAEAAAEAQPSA